MHVRRLVILVAGVVVALATALSASQAAPNASTSTAQKASSPGGVAAAFEAQVKALAKQQIGGFAKKPPWNIDLFWQGPINGCGTVFGVAAKYEASKYHQIASFKEISNQGDVTTETTQLENAVHTNPSAIVIQPAGVGLSGAAIAAIAKHIPVVLCAENLPTNNTFTAMVNANDVTIASHMAQYLVSQLKGKGNVLVLGGNPTFQSTQIFQSAGLDVFKKHPGIQIVGTEYANYDIATGKQKVLAFLARGKKVDAVFSDGSEAAVGAIEALAQEHATMPVFAVDNVLNGFLRLAIQYKINFYGAPLAPAMAAPCVDTAVKLLEGKKVSRFIDQATVLPGAAAYTSSAAKSHYLPKMNDNFIPPAIGPLSVYLRAGFGA